VTTHCFAGVDAVPAVARPAPTGRFSLAPGSVAAPGGRAVPGRPGRALSRSRCRPWHGGRCGQGHVRRWRDPRRPLGMAFTALVW